jgi:predicted transcriptional regulator
VPILTIRLPEEKHGRLKALARARAVSLNRLMEELATVALAKFDAETRFQATARRADPALRT